MAQHAYICTLYKPQSSPSIAHSGRNKSACRQKYQAFRNIALKNKIFFCSKDIGGTSRVAVDTQAFPSLSSSENLVHIPLTIDMAKPRECGIQFPRTNLSTISLQHMPHWKYDQIQVPKAVAYKNWTFSRRTAPKRRNRSITKSCGDAKIELFPRARPPDTTFTSWYDLTLALVSKRAASPVSPGCIFSTSPPTTLWISLGFYSCQIWTDTVCAICCSYDL